MFLFSGLGVLQVAEKVTTPFFLSMNPRAAAVLP